MVYGPHVAIICQVCISQRTGLYQWNHSPQNFLATTLVSLEEYICISKTLSPAKNLQHFSNNSLFQEQSTTYLCKIIKFWYTVYTTFSIIIHLVSQYQRKTGVHCTQMFITPTAIQSTQLNSPQNKLLNVSRFFYKNPQTSSSASAIMKDIPVTADVRLICETCCSLCSICVCAASKARITPSV